MYKRFFIKFIALFLSAITIIFIICDRVIKNCDFVISTPRDRSNFNVYQWQEKKIEIAKKKSENGRKVVFVGGSSTLFGINTKEIENYYKIPMVNFGSHAGYTIIIFEDAKRILNKNDIVIIPLEYNGYTQSYQKHLRDMELEYIFLLRKDIYNKLPLEKKMDCMCFFINNLTNIKSPKTVKKIKEECLPDFESSYSLKYWNENGDNIFVRKQEKRKIDKIYNESKVSTKFYFAKKDMKYLKNKNSFLNSFIKYAHENNIKLYFIAPAFMINSKIDSPSGYNIKELWDYAGYDYLDNIDECFYDKKYFYDTNYHLTTEGAKLRTKQIIKLLDKYSIFKDF